MCVCAVGRFPVALKCRWWVGGGGGQCSGCKLWTDRCSVLSAVYSWHSGSMGHFNTSTLYPHGTADRASDLSLSLSLSSLSSHLSLPLFLCLDWQISHLSPFIQYFEVQLVYLRPYLVEPQSGHFSWLNRSESGWLVRSMNFYVKHWHTKSIHRRF